MPNQLNENASNYLRKTLNDMKIEALTDFKVVKILRDNESLEVFTQEGGEQYSFDHIILNIGIRPNVLLAKKAGLEVDKGLVVDNYMKTSDDRIFAAGGDISQHYGSIYGLWTMASEQGKVAALNILGHKALFGGIPRSNSLKVLDIDLFSIGEHVLKDSSYSVLEVEDRKGYIAYYIKNQRLVGGICIGYPAIGMKIKAAVERKQEFNLKQLKKTKED